MTAEIDTIDQLPEELEAEFQRRIEEKCRRAEEEVARLLRCQADGHRFPEQTFEPGPRTCDVCGAHEY